MEKNQESNNFGNPALCSKCNSFYANPQYISFCSKCYKEIQNVLQNVNQTKELQISSSKEIEKDKVKEDNKIKQTDKEICWICQKGTGILGYSCKCGYTFCKKHRLPENHSCDFDFVNEGKELIKKNNPSLKKDKLEKI